MRSSPERSAQNSTNSCADSLVEPITKTRQPSCCALLIDYLSHPGKDQCTYCCEVSGFFTKYGAVFAGLVSKTCPDEFRAHTRSDVDRTFSTASAVTSDNASRTLRRYRGSPTGVSKFGDLVELNMEMSLDSPPVSSLFCPEM